MHTDICRDALEWWPQDAPTDVTVSALPVAGAITNPIRLPGDGQWIGIWGTSFAGLRVGFASTGQSYPVISGAAFPYPVMPDGRTIDVYLSRDTGGAGLATIARFKTREAAEAWGGRPGPGSGGAAVQLPSRSTITRDTVAGGNIVHVWTQAGFMYATIVAGAANAAPIIIGGSFSLAAGASLSGFVNTATGFSATGSNGDILDIIEYGRP